MIAEEILSDTIREKINRITDLETINKLNLQIERENLAKIEADLKNQEITGEDIYSETKYAEEKYKRIMEIQKKLIFQKTHVIYEAPLKVGIGGCALKISVRKICSGWLIYARFRNI